MKLTKALIRFSLGIGLFILAGCIQTQVTMLDFAAKYPPARGVEVLYQEPHRPFKSFAVVEAEGSASETQLLESLREKAKALGADAIIVLPPRQKEGTGGLLFPILKGIAIKYAYRG
jgi:hypothetical protein